MAADPVGRIAAGFARARGNPQARQRRRAEQCVATFLLSHFLTFSPFYFSCLLSFLLLPAGQVAAAEPDPPEKVREIFVPFKDLNVLLENQPHRVLLSRDEYDALVKKAKTTPATHAPRAAALLAADYSGVCDSQRVRLSGTLSIDVLEDGLHAMPLDLGGVGLLSAKLDGRDAPIGRDPIRPAQPAGRGSRPPCACAGNDGPAGDHRGPADSLFPPAEGAPPDDCGWLRLATWKSKAAPTLPLARWIMPPA